MTKRQKHRRNVFSADSNLEEDDFILVDLDVMLNQEEPSPVPLNHVLDDEEAIDGLLIDSEFDVKGELEEADREANTLVIDDIELADDFSNFDQFVIEPVEEAEKKRLKEAEEIPDTDIVSRSGYDEIPAEEDAIDRLLVDVGFDANDELEEADKEPDAPIIDDRELAGDFPDTDIVSRSDYDEIPDKEAAEKLLVDANEGLKEDAGVLNGQVIDRNSCADGLDVNFKGQSAMTPDKNIFDSGGSGAAPDKGSINLFLGKEENHQATKQEQASSKATCQEEPLCSLNNNAGITESSSFILEQEAIKMLMDGYENKVKKAAIITYASLAFGIVALLSTIIMGVIVSRVQTKVSKLTELVAIIEEDLSGVAEKNSDIEINDRGSAIEQSNQKVSGLAELDNPQAAASVPEKKKEQSSSLPERSKNNTAAVISKQASLNKSFDRKTKTPNSDKKKPSETNLKITSVNRKTNNAKSTSSWSVNLTAYKQLSEAKRKAAKYTQNGFPVKVKAVDMKHTKWYRLKVTGFKNKEKADLYAAKIKKSLKLSSVSVGIN